MMAAVTSGGSRINGHRGIDGAGGVVSVSTSMIVVV